VVAHASCLTPHRGPRIIIHGDKASFLQYGLDGQEQALKDGKRPGDPNWGETPEISAVIGCADGTRKSVGILPGSYETYYDNVAKAIAGGAQLFVSAQSALTTMRILEAAVVSADEKRQVTP
jgi:scyllo-inositol 2-dehydrogenase (NADP+)